MKFSDICNLQQLSELSSLLCHCIHQHETKFVDRFLSDHNNINSVVLSVAGSSLFVIISQETELWLNPIETKIVAIELQEVYDWLDEIIILEGEG